MEWKEGRGRDEVGGVGSRVATAASTGVWSAQMVGKEGVKRTGGGKAVAAGSIGKTSPPGFKLRSGAGAGAGAV